MVACTNTVSHGSVSVWIAILGFRTAFIDDLVPSGAGSIVSGLAQRLMLLIIVLFGEAIFLFHLKMIALFSRESVPVSCNQMMFEIYPATVLYGRNV